MRLGIKVRHGRPYHPQTQGKAERFHQTLKADLLRRNDWQDLQQAQQRFDRFRHIYNHDRPHDALDLNVPADRYLPSKTNYPEVMNPLQYDSQTIVRTVKAKGEITFKGKNFYIGQAFKGINIAIKENKNTQRFHIYLGAIPIGYIRYEEDPNKPRHNYRKLHKLKNNM